VTSGATRNASDTASIASSRPTSAVATARQVGGTACVAGRERVVLLQHPAVERAGGVGRLHAQLVDQAAAQVPVDGERVGLPSAGVEGVHEQRGEGLAVRVPLDQRRELTDHGPAAAQASSAAARSSTAARRRSARCTSWPSRSM
jgi:hypothetical protein